MRRRSLALLLLAAALATGPALAEVLAEGKPKGGYYLQKVSASNGTRYLCRSTTDARIQKAAALDHSGLKAIALKGSSSGEVQIPHREMKDEGHHRQIKPHAGSSRCQVAGKSFRGWSGQGKQRGQLHADLGTGRTSGRANAPTISKVVRPAPPAGGGAEAPTVFLPAMWQEPEDPPPAGPMPPLTRLATAAASNGLLTGQIVFSLSYVGAC
jgi:hypothetical protein